MGIQDRIKLVLKMHNLTPSIFADAIGVQRSNVSHVLSGRNKPGLDFLEKVLVEYPRVNALWLITGEVGQEREVTNVNDLFQQPDPVKQTSPVKQPDLEDQLRSTEESAQNVPNERVVEREVEKIVVFYTDQTFKAYKPSDI
jgi:transcriptional regulator with XRE-family HTH domain